MIDRLSCPDLDPAKQTTTRMELDSRGRTLCCDTRLPSLLPDWLLHSELPRLSFQFAVDSSCRARVAPRSQGSLLHHLLLGVVLCMGWPFDHNITTRPTGTFHYDSFILLSIFLFS